MPTPMLLFAYFSPETYLPVTSVIATAVGMVMMFGRTAVRFVFRGFRRASKQSHPGHLGVLKGPHRAPSIRKASRPVDR